MNRFFDIPRCGFQRLTDAERRVAGVCRQLGEKIEKKIEKAAVKPPRLITNLVSNQSA